jgi:hypothetical protein
MCSVILRHVAEVYEQIKYSTIKITVSCNVKPRSLVEIGVTCLLPPDYTLSPGTDEGVGEVCHGLGAPRLMGACKVGKQLV